MGVRGFQTALAPDAPGEVSDLEAWVDVAVAVRAETGAAAALPVMLVLGALQFRIFSRLVFGWTNADFSTKAVFSAVFIIILVVFLSQNLVIFQTFLHSLSLTAENARDRSLGK